ncbi:hypothetical protein RIR_jg24529.t1 [Rhizophagus irregularis DAOM 181602=DAOM 197198]|nr:hypothetical protein RIR_jg24529.t1 [Rhizophagus irregularis DAOM 181602=DAOM 197198]
MPIIIWPKFGSAVFKKIKSRQTCCLSRSGPVKLSCDSVINNYDDENNDNHRDSRSNRDIEYTTISDAKYGMKKKASVKIANYILVFFIQIWPYWVHQ